MGILPVGVSVNFLSNIDPTARRIINAGDCRRVISTSNNPRIIQ